MDPTQFRKLNPLLLLCPLLGMLGGVVVASCAHPGLKWEHEQGGVDDGERTVRIPEDGGQNQVCVQWRVPAGPNEGTDRFEYRCVPLDTLRRQLFPESYR